jgi:NTE family protein
VSAHDLAAELLGEELSAEGQRLRTAMRHDIAVSSLMPDVPARGLRPLDPMVLLHAARRPWRVRPGALVSGLLPRGRTELEPIARSIRYLHGSTWPDRDLRICAVRARNGRRVVFGAPGAPETDVGTAVAASCAIPAWFQPVTVDGRVYVDGGVHSHTNAGVVLRDRPDLVVVLSPMSVAPGAGLRPDLGVRLAMRQVLGREVRRLRAAGCTVVTLQPTRTDLAVMGINPLHGGRIDEVVTTVAASVRDRLRARPEIAQLVSPGLRAAG